MFFKTDDNKLHKSKVVVNAERTQAHDFDISDEVKSLDFPYFYILNGNLI